MLGLMMPRSRAGQVTATSDDGWSGSYGSVRTKAGVHVNPDVAMSLAAALCATRVIAESLSELPLPLYERVSNDERRQAYLPVADLFKYGPNPLMTSTPFRESRTAHQVNCDGGGFAEIEFDKRGNVKYLWPIHPSRVSRADKGEYAYLVRNDDGTQVPLYAYEMLHIPGIFAEDGIWSTGVVSYGAEVIGGALGTDRAHYADLAAGGQPKGILEAGGLQDRDKREAYRREWEKVHGNPATNVPTIAIVSPGTKYTPLGTLGTKTTEIVMARGFNKTEIATLYNIPAYKIPGAEGKETAGTVEQKAIEFVTYSLMPWAKKWEEQCGLKLLTESQRKQFYFEHNFDAILRGEIDSRYNAYRIAFSIGIMTINEMRKKENMPGIGPAGDQHFVPANMTTAQRALNGDFGNGGRLGSDSTGSPADDPMDRQAMLDRFHHDWLKSLSNSVRDDAKSQLKALKHELPERKVDYREGARLALLDVLGRMLTKESQAAQAAMKNKDDFDSWMRQFYQRQEALVADALESACWNLRAAGIVQWGEPAKLAAWLRARNCEALQACYNGDTPETAARRLRAWPTDRAKELADEIMGDK